MNRAAAIALAIAASSLVTACAWGAPTPAPVTGASRATRTPSAATSQASEVPAPTFASPLYGYAVAGPGGWTATAATMYADDPASTGTMATDMFRVPGTDTTIGALAWDLGGGSYATWAKAYHDDGLPPRLRVSRRVIAPVPRGCDGGDPSAWALIRVGTTNGHLLQECDSAEVMVPIGKRVYVFSWGNDTVEDGAHFPQSGFEAFLLGVTLPGANAADRPLWSPSPAP
jgi:hypothetical protein